MVNGKHALIFGRNGDAPWHPLKEVEVELVSLLSEDFEVRVTDRGESLLALGLGGVDLLVGLDDRWSEELDTRWLDSVETWVRGGGRLLLVHNGICWARLSRWRKWIGGRFTGHGPAKVLTYRRMSDGASFELFEEPYRFSSPWFSSRTMIAHYWDEGKRFPAMWTRRLGKGLVGYAQPGHNAASFQNQEYRRWLVELVRDLTVSR